MIRYSTNWMGPINLDWIKKNGNHWAVGRIDVSGDVPEYTEIGLPMMHEKSWYGLQKFLEGNHFFSDEEQKPGLVTEELWTLDQIVEEYEKSNPKIIWWKDE